MIFFDKFKNYFASPLATTPVEWEMTSRDWIAITTTSLAAFMALLDIQITNSSLKEIQSSLGIDFTEGGWISTAYLIGEIMVIPLAPLLVDCLGLKNYVITGSLLFAGISAVCAMSWDLPSIACFRFLQGLAGGTLIPVAFQMILIYMPSHRRNIGLAIFGLVATLAPSLGPSIGGYLAMEFGWRWVFLVNIFPSLLVVYLTRMSFPISYTSWRVLRGADWIGACLLCSTLGCLTFVLEEGSSRGWLVDPITASSIVIVILGLPSFVFWELGHNRPLIALSLFRDKGFAVSAVITFISAQCLYGGMYALSIFLAGIRGFSPVEIGGVLAWAGIPQIIVIPFIPFLMRKYDVRILAIFGMTVFAWSNWSNTGINEYYGGSEFRLSLIERALSQPFFTIPLSALAIQKITPSMAGMASSVINMLRNLGGSFGIALVSNLVRNQVPRYSEAIGATIDLNQAEVIERVKMVRYGLWFWGYDTTLAEAATVKIIGSQVLRESYFHCFNKIFSILSLELVFSVFMILFIPDIFDVNSQKKEFMIH